MIRNRVMNSVVNKYLLHNRSIMFKNDQDVERFFIKEKLKIEKHKQPSTLNVKANLEKLSLDDMQVFRFNFRHQIDKKFYIFTVDSMHYNHHRSIGDCWIKSL